MRKHFTLHAATALLAASSLLSCSKEHTPLPQAAVPVAGPNKQDIAANYPFDWETATKMPVSAASPVDVFMPWSSQGGASVDPGILDDYKRIDGWELVYNSFSPDNFPSAGYRGTIPTASQQPAGGLYFALYNRFRGILRYYMYVPTGHFGSSTQLSHGLRTFTSGGTTKMLNFEGRDIVNVDNNIEGFTATSKDGVSQGGGWYAMQYQLAYDPAFAGTTFPNPGFEWYVNSLSVTQIETYGTEIGTMKGTAVTPQPKFNWASTILNAGFAAVEVLSGVGAFGTFFKEGVGLALSNGSKGSTKSFLSGMFGKTSGGSQTIDLAINSKIETKGTATTSQEYKSNTFVFPGQNSGSGIAPLISYPLGLFNLSTVPVVTARRRVTMAPGKGGDNEVNVTYVLDEAAVRNALQFNPAVINSNSTGATINTLRVEFVVLNPHSEWRNTGVPETIGTIPATAGNPLGFTYLGLALPTGPSGTPVVRVSFYVQPNNGAPQTLVVKTFAVNVRRI
ncbi:hypothetical protein [Hymenobacter weizhouensis]|uniref:hypothetical protein n=1 Tax=Hymenobacter sp. YIM 151500-1 TaxID=2987689 RepID=UPI002226463A|nr:hypothetical protein [Hymenobacter sp. YIM 151500-1]UYZ63296.1 hypothetical protein OIS53_00265 [Hymenobacter sp. YIM 151500-1]